MTPPTVQAISLAGSGPSRRPYGASRALTIRTVTPGWTRTRRPVVEHLDRGEAGAGVDQDRVAQRLPGQRRTAAAEGQRRADPGTRAHHRRDLRGVARDRDRLRGQQVVRGVVRPDGEVEGTLGDPAGGVTERVDGAAAPSAQRSPLPSRSAMCSACRIASATMVRVGLAAAPVVITEPSLTNRPGTSCASPNAPTTPSSARSLIRQVPRLWVAGYGGVWWVPTAPTASYSRSARW